MKIKMSHRATISLDDECFEFLEKVAGDNRSAYINQVLKERYEAWLKEACIKANIEEANDVEYQEELMLWDVALMDGIAGSE